MEDLLARRVLPFADGRPDVETIQIPALRERSQTVRKSHSEGLNYVIIPGAQLSEGRGFARKAFMGFGGGDKLAHNAKKELKPLRFPIKFLFSGRWNVQIRLNG